MVTRKEIQEEVQSVISGKTIDAMFPPLIFVLMNTYAGLDVAVVVSLCIAIILTVIRVTHQQNWKYALGGMAGVILASGLAYLTKNAANYFIGSVLSSAFLFLAAIGSLFISKPMAAWASHLSRGWPLDWYWRRDVKPAYKEVTWLWTVLILGRLLIQYQLLKKGDAANLAWTNILLGWPVTLLVLVISYIYGIWRLNRLGGPGVEEYKEGKKPPWRGQTRGF